MINLHHRNGTTGLERSRYRLDIPDLRGSKLEQTYVPSQTAQVCPGCASGVNPGDRFCQECGTRIGTNRSKRANLKDKSESGSASIICINCGTTNKALSTMCSDCKIPLGPAQRRREDQLVGEQAGLRGSLTTRSKKQGFRNAQIATGSSDNLPPHGLNSWAENVHTQAPKTTSRDSEPSSSFTQNTDNKAAHRAAVETTTNKTDAGDTTSEPSSASQTESSASRLDPQSTDGAASAPIKKARVRQRLPGFVSPLFKRQNLSGDSSVEGAALDYLFADPSQAGESLSPFEKLISETRSMGGYFSISTAQYHIESFFERVPLPLLFILVSIVIVCVTATATTKWNRYEQRLKAIDRIAMNAEEKMRVFRLDEVIESMQELEKTEKGDLPPRARAVLNQSLWLRSYSFAKQHQYSKAISDLSFVTSDFISFEDVVEKLAEYKKLLAVHPEFDNPGNSVNETVKPDKRELDAKPSLKSPVQRKPQVKTQSNDSASAAGQKSVSKQPLQAVTTPVLKETGKTEKRSRKSEASNLDRDMKRYSNLLVEYFSTAESNPSEHVAEPPSYEEWTKGGKRDF